MKLIECHIDNFGVLSDADFNFLDGINCFCLGNGKGKTTLAAFLRIMLFGFDNSSKRDELVNERKKFMPWNNKTYGGNLTFEVNDKKYMIAKTFGQKEKDDCVKLLDLDSNIEIFIESEPGVYFFNIDSYTYEHTACIRQNMVELNPSFLMKYLGDDVSEENNDYILMQNKLKDAINHYSDVRKTGELYKEQEKLYELRQSIKYLRANKVKIEEETLAIKELEDNVYNYNKFKINTVYNWFVFLGIIFFAFAFFLASDNSYEMPLFLFTPSVICFVVSFILRYRIKYPKNKDKMLVDELVERKARLSILQDEYEKIRDNADNYYHWQEVHNEKLHRYELLKLTEKLVNEAYINYITSVSSPLKDRFDRFIKALSVDENKYLINSNGEINVFENSFPRKIKALSEGRKDIINLALRFSFIDLMFKDEKPVIIMDDPFSNLDDEALDLAIDLINNLDKEYQIVYFTCSGNRSI